MSVCLEDGCSKEEGHSGDHDTCSGSVWGFMAEKDKKKLNKAGFATPRGGAKGAYQNHVSRTNKVIVPFERFFTAPLDSYKNGYVVRIYPNQYFASAGNPKPEFDRDEYPSVGDDAFVLYRTHDQLRELPPPEGWSIRSLFHDGEEVDARGAGVEDRGEYVIRVSKHGANEARSEGPPQGIFAPEYADELSNFLSKCVLALLIVRCVDSPYAATQARGLEAVLRYHGVLDFDRWEARGLLRDGHTTCPLCLKKLRYAELHDQVAFDDESALGNAAEQVLNSTRSTVVNLFHMTPLIYEEIEHVPANVAWGHATCNTKLGQRKCHSLVDLMNEGAKVGFIDQQGAFSSFGWISENFEMIRSPAGAVWIRLVEDHFTQEEQSANSTLIQRFMNDLTGPSR